MKIYDEITNEELTCPRAISTPPGWSLGIQKSPMKLWKVQ